MKNKLFKETRTNPKAGTEGLHFVVTQDDTGDTVLHVFDSEDQAGLYHGQLRGYGGVKRIGRLKGSKSMSFGYINDGVAKQFGAEPRMIRHDQGETNPARRSDESPLYVKYLSLKSNEEPFMMQGTKYEYVWAEYPGGIKDIGVYSYANDLVYSYDSFRQMMNLDRMNPRSRNAMNSEGLHFIWVLEKDRSAYLHVYKSLQKATSALNTFSKIKSGTIDPSIGRVGSRGISQLGRGIGNSKMTIDDIAAEVEKKYGVEPEVIRHDLDDGDTNPVKPRKGESSRDFTARCMSEEKMSFPKTKQRIAVCLSKSRKRNPVYDTGSDE